MRQRLATSACRASEGQKLASSRRTSPMILAGTHVGQTRVTLVLVQVAREALVNGSRYSAARRIRVELRPVDAWAQLTIEDDGRGFSPDQVDRSSHFGLQLMRERVDAVDGELSVQSIPGAGTTVIARVPVVSSPRDSNQPSQGTPREG